MNRFVVLIIVAVVAFGIGYMVSNKMAKNKMAKANGTTTVTAPATEEAPAA